MNTATQVITSGKTIPNGKLMGKILEVHTPHRKSFNVWLENSREIFVCISKVPVYYHVGDAIVSYIHMDNERRMHILGDPFVTKGKDRDSVINAIRMSLGLGKRGYNIAHTIYENLQDKWTSKNKERDTDTIDVNTLESASTVLIKTGIKTGTPSPLEIADKLDRLSIEWKRGDQMKVIRDLTTIYNPKHISKSLMWWYKYRVLSQLYLLQLNNKEIRGSYMDEIELYDRCLNNPYTIVNLSLDKCHKILAMTEISVSALQSRTAQIARSVHTDLIKRGWIGTPISMLQSRYHDLQSHIPYLLDDYKYSIEEQTIYLPYPFTVESTISKKLIAISNQAENQPSRILFNHRSLTREQKDAITGALTNSLTIITGCAGSGKTTIIREIIYNLQRLKLSYLVTSFTGKAVCRLREVLMDEGPATMDHFIAAGNKKGFKYLIIDEVSMVTSHLLYRFGRRYGWDYNIILVGDVNQLPPIGWGNLLSELIKSKKIKTHYLTKNLRVIPGEEMLAENCEQIIHATSGVDLDFKTGPSFNLISGDVDDVMKVVNQLMNRGISIYDLTIVTPYNRDVNIFNNRCHQLLSKETFRQRLIDVRNKEWVIGDRVMYLVNNFGVGLVNGDEGKVTDIEGDNLMVTFDSNKDKTAHRFLNLYLNRVITDDGEIDDKKKALTLDNLTHSFALTIHKSQGSESRYIIFYMPWSGNSDFLNRNLIYTALTRAKESVWCIGDLVGLKKAATRAPGYRHDNLHRRIAKSVQPSIEQLGEDVNQLSLI